MPDNAPDLRADEAMSRVAFTLTIIMLAAAGCKPPRPADVPADPPRQSESDYQARLQAAMEISSQTTRDEALASLAVSAAAAGEGEITRGALQAISSLTTKDDASARAAAKLSEAGHEADALEVARQISSQTARDEALKAIAGE